MFHSISSCTPNSLVTTAFVATQNQLLDIWSNVTVFINGVVTASRPISVTANSIVEAEVTTPSGYLDYNFYPYYIDGQPQCFAVVNKNNYAPTVKPPDSRKRWFNYIHKKFTISFYGSRSSDFLLGFAREYVDVDELHIVLDALNRTVNFYSKNNNMICRVELPDSPVNYKKIPVDSITDSYTEELLVLCSDGRLYKIKFDTRFSYSDEFTPSVIPVFPLDDLPYLQDLPNGLSFTDAARKKFLKSLLPMVSALDFKNNLIWLGGSNNVYVLNKNFTLLKTITVGSEQILDIACIGSNAIVTTKSQSIILVTLAGGYTLIDQFSAVGSPCTMPDGESVAIPVGNAKEVRIYDSLLNSTSYPTPDFVPAYARIFDGRLWVTGYDTNEVLLFVNGGFLRKSFNLKTALISVVGTSILGVHCMQEITTLNNLGIQKIIPFEVEPSRGPLNYISTKPELIKVLGQDSIYPIGGPGVTVWVNGQTDYPIRNDSYVTASYRAVSHGTSRCNFIIGEHAFDFDVTAVSSIVPTDFYKASNIALDKLTPVFQSYLTPNVGNIDLGQTNLDLGFNFNFFGNIYSNIAVSTNGYITFGSDTRLFADPRFGSIAADTLYIDPENLYQGFQIVNTDPNNVVFGTLDNGETPGVYSKFSSNIEWTSYRLRWVGISANAYPLGNSLPTTTSIVAHNELPLNKLSFAVNDYVHGPGITTPTQVTSKIVYTKKVIAVKNSNSTAYNLYITAPDTTIKKYSKVFQASTFLGYVQGTNYTRITGSRVLGKTTTSIIVDGNIPGAVATDLDSFIYRISITSVRNPIGYNLVSDTFTPLTNISNSTIVLLDNINYDKVYTGLTFTHDSITYSIVSKSSLSNSITINVPITISTSDSAVFQYTEINFSSLPSLSVTGNILYDRNLLEISDPTPIITTPTEILIEGNFAGLSTSVSSSAGSVYTFKKNVPVQSSYTYEVGFYLGKSLQYIEFYYNNTQHSATKLLGLATSNSSFRSISTQVTAGKSVVFAGFADTGVFQLLGQGSFDYSSRTFEPRALEFIRVPAERSNWAKFEALVTQKISRLDQRYISLTYGYLAVNNSEDLFNYPIATGDVITIRIPFGKSTTTIAPLLCIGTAQQAIPAMPDSNLGTVPEIVFYQDNVPRVSVNSASITVTISGDYQIPPYYRSFISDQIELDFMLTRSGTTSNISGINHSFLANDIITVGNIISSSKLYDTSSVVIVGSNSVLRITLRTVSDSIFDNLNFGTLENPYTRYREYQLYSISPAEYMDNVVYRSTNLTITSTPSMTSTLSIPTPGLDVYINGAKQTNNLNITVSSNQTIEMHWLVPNYFQSNIVVYQRKVDAMDASNVFVPIGLWSVNNFPIINQPSLIGPSTTASFTLSGQHFKSVTSFTHGLQSNVTTSTDFKSGISSQYIYVARQVTGTITSDFLPFATYGIGEINSDYINTGNTIRSKIQGEYLPTSSTFLIDGPLADGDNLRTYISSNAIYGLKENLSNLIALGLITAEYEISQDDHRARFISNFIQSIELTSNDAILPAWARLQNILTGSIPNNIFHKGVKSSRSKIPSTKMSDQTPLFGQMLALRNSLRKQSLTKFESNRLALRNLYRSKLNSNRFELLDLYLTSLNPTRPKLVDLTKSRIEPQRVIIEPATKAILQPDFFKLNYNDFRLDLEYLTLTSFRPFKLDHVMIKEKQVPFKLDHVMIQEKQVPFKLDHVMIQEKQIPFRIEHKFIQVSNFEFTLTPFLNVENSLRNKLESFLNNPSLIFKKFNYQLYQEELWEMLEYTKYGAFDTYFLAYADQGRNSDNRFNLGTPKNYSPYLPYQSHEASSLLKGSKHGIFYIHSGNVLAHVDGINVHYSFDYLYQYSNIKINSWTLGSGSVSGYFVNESKVGENTRIIDQDPWAQKNIVWATQSNIQVGSADGGWSTGWFSVQHKDDYRFSVWVRRTSHSATGNIYHGFNTNAILPVRTNALGYTDASVIRIDDGIGDADPYFDVRPASDYEKDKWYLHVVYVYGSDFVYDPANPGLYPNAGIYDINGRRLKNNIYSGTGSTPSLGFKFDSNTTAVLQRVYHNNATDDTTSFQFFGPRVDIINGFEPKLGALLRGGVWKKLPTIYSPPPLVPESLILDEYNRTFYMNVYVDGSTLHYGGFSGSLGARQGRTYGFGAFDEYSQALNESQLYVNAQPINIVATDYWNYRLFFDYSEPEYSITIRDPSNEVEKIVADMGDVIRLDIRSVRQNEALGFVIEPADVDVSYVVIGGGGGGGGGIGGGGGGGGVLTGTKEFEVYAEYPVRVGKAGYGSDYITSNLSINGDNTTLGFLAALGGGGGGSSFEGNIPNRFYSPGVTLSTANVFARRGLLSTSTIDQVFYNMKAADYDGNVINPIQYTGYDTNGYSPFTVPIAGDTPLKYTINVNQIPSVNRPIVIEFRILQQTNNLDNLKSTITLGGPGIIFSQKTLTYTGTGWHYDLFKGDLVRDGGTGNSTVVGTTLITPPSTGNLTYTFANSNLLSTTVFGYKIFARAPLYPSEPNTTWYTRPAPGRETFSEEFDLDSLGTISPGKYTVIANSLYAPYLIYYNTEPAFIYGKKSGVAEFGNLTVGVAGPGNPRILRVQANGSPAGGAVSLSIYNEYGMPVIDLTSINNNYASTGASVTLTNAVNGRPGTQLVDDLYKIARASPEIVFGTDTAIGNIHVNSVVTFMPSISTTIHDLPMSQFLKDYGVWDFAANTTTTYVNYQVNITEPGIYDISGSALDQATIEIDGDLVLTLDNFQTVQSTRKFFPAGEISVNIQAITDPSLRSPIQVIDLTPYTLNTGLVALTIQPAGITAGGHGGGGAYEPNIALIGLGGQGDTQIGGHNGGNAKLHSSGLGGGGSGGGAGEPGLVPVFYTVSAFEQLSNVTVTTVHSSNNVVIAANGAIGGNVEECWTVGAGGAGGITFYSNIEGVFRGFGGLYGGGNSGAISGSIGEPGTVNSGGGGGAASGDILSDGAAGGEGFIMLKYNKMFELDLDPGLTYFTEILGDTKLTVITNGLGNLRWKVVCFPYTKTVCAPIKGPTFPTKWFQRGG